MSACEFTLTKGIDVLGCIASVTTGWVPDWLVPLLPYWPWLAVAVGAGVAWRFAGIPGLTAFAAAVGFILGRRSVDHHEHVSGLDAAPPPVVKKRPTIFDGFR